MNRPNSSVPARDSETYKTAFDNILSNYLRARLKPFGREHTLWKVFEGLSSDFRTYVSSRPTLKVKWSVGKGNWASVPWIAFLDQRETNSTQYGVYPVYLFREDLSGIYIALNHGISLLKEKHGTPESRRILRERTAQLLLDIPAIEALKDAGFSLDNKIALHTIPGLEKDYEASTIAYKLYRRNEIPNDTELLGDRRRRQSTRFIVIATHFSKRQTLLAHARSGSSTLSLKVSRYSRMQMSRIHIAAVTTGRR